ncbi:hypothetical protein KY362_02940 [Candidatus Woesearchaeota archaeon]|nr:hypothetical protein [Candidatus Woesearchaeota archaeon]
MILIRIIVILLVVPMILAYMTCRSKSSIFSLSKAIINICLAGVIFISISLNRAIFFDLTNKDILYVYLISLAVIFGLGLLVYAASRKLFSDDAVAYSFYATQKNVGASIAIGIFLFNTDTVVPAIITLAIQFIYFIIFEEVFVKKRLFKKILRNQKY